MSILRKRKVPSGPWDPGWFFLSLYWVLGPVKESTGKT
jgi:hypothetical protein